MKKAVLMSIRPDWCELILRGQKTLEIRKTRPRLETPFTVYIYMTKGNACYPITIGGTPYICSASGGQIVVGEFTCNKIESFDVPYPAFQLEMREDILARACVDYYPMHRYAYHDTLYAWDISNLRIYKTPKSLREFHAPMEDHKYYHPPFQRPPQSWCYVEEIANGK